MRGSFSRVHAGLPIKEILVAPLRRIRSFWGRGIRFDIAMVSDLVIIIIEFFKRPLGYTMICAFAQNIVAGLILG